MGCCASASVPPKSEESASLVPASSDRGTNFMSLRHEEVRILRKSWENVLVKQPRFCELLFLNLFRLHPELRHSFGFDGVTEEELVSDSRFLGHAANFQSFFQGIHDNLESENKLVSQAVKVGRSHARMKIRNPDIFESTYWLLIARIALNMIVDISQGFIEKHSAKNPHFEGLLEHLWQLVLLRIILEMMNSFYDMLLKNSMAASQLLSKQSSDTTHSRGKEAVVAPHIRQKPSGKMSVGSIDSRGSMKSPPTAGRNQDLVGNGSINAGSSKTPEPTNPWPAKKTNRSNSVRSVPTPDA